MDSIQKWNWIQNSKIQFKIQCSAYILIDFTAKLMTMYGYVMFVVSRTDLFFPNTHFYLCLPFHREKRGSRIETY